MNTKTIISVLAVLLILGIGLVTYSKSKDTAENTTPQETKRDVLSGTEWVWKETLANDGTLTTPKQAGKFTLSFKADGSMNGTTDCNGFFGTYEVNESSISFGPIGATKMFCEGSQEEAFMRMVSDSNQFIFNGDNILVLLIKFDSGSVTFTRK